MLLMAIALVLIIGQKRIILRKQHQAEYQLHDVTIKELASAKKEKQDLQKQQKTLQVIENNFDAMIREASIKVLEKEPSQKTQEDVLS